MLIELQKIPYSTKGRDRDFDNWLEWDNKNINPLRDLLSKATKELGEITNQYEGLLTEEEKEKYRKDLETEKKELKNREQKNQEDINTQLIRNHIAYYEERLNTGQDGFQLGINRGFSTMSLKELKELRERVPNKYQFDLRLKKLIEIELEWEKRFNGTKELPKDYKWGENHLDIFKADEWLKNIRGGEVKLIQTYTKCPITFMVYAQNKQPKEFEELDNEKFIDEKGVELWGWCNPFKDIGKLKECHSYRYFKADDKYLILINQGDTTEHKWLKDGCVADYGGGWGSGGCIQQYQELELTEKTYREKNEGKSYSCLKGFSKIFMTERAWAVAKLIKEKKVYIPEKDFYPECKTIKEKADECITEMNKDYYLFKYPEREETNSHTLLNDLRFWIVKSYGEERFKQEYEKAKKENMPIAFKEIENDFAGKFGYLKNYLEYKDKDSKYAQRWLKDCFEAYNHLKRLADEMGKTVKPFNEYKEEVKERIKQQLAEKIKKEYDSEIAKEVVTELAEEEKLMSKSLNIDEEIERAKGVV